MFGATQLKLIHYHIFKRKQTVTNVTEKHLFKQVSHIWECNQIFWLSNKISKSKGTYKLTGWASDLGKPSHVWAAWIRKTEFYLEQTNSWQHAGSLRRKAPLCTHCVCEARKQAAIIRHIYSSQAPPQRRRCKNTLMLRPPEQTAEPSPITLRHAVVGDLARQSTDWKQSEIHQHLCEEWLLLFTAMH